MIQKGSSLSIRRQCALLGLNRSSLFYTPHEPMSKAPAFDEAIMARIDFWHTRCPYLGSRKLVTRLQEDGVQVCRKTVRRLMQKMGIYAVYPKPNLSNRNFKEAIVVFCQADFPIFVVGIPHRHRGKIPTFSGPCQEACSTTASCRMRACSIR